MKPEFMKKKNDINYKLKLSAKKYKKKFKSNFISLALFGSFARGEEDKESDIDLFLLCDKLPKNLIERDWLVREPLLDIIERGYNVIAKTKEEFLSYFPTFYLDLGLDAKVIYDKNNFLHNKLKRIREIIKSAGLRRKKIGNEFSWEWEKQPKKGWGIDWSGFYEF